MKIECPSCKKVLIIKDEYAGKTGKCPECGDKITLPAVDPLDVSDAGNEESRRIMESNSAEFIDTPDAGLSPPETDPRPVSDPPPSSGSHKLIAAVAVILIAAAAVGGYVYLQSPSRIQLAEISLYNVEAERYVKRSEGLPTEAVLAWQTAIKRTSGEYLTSRQLFFKLPNLDGLWNNDSFSESASSHYLARVAAVSPEALKNWQTALNRVADDTVTEGLSETLLRVIEIDPLFDGASFSADASAEFISRLDTVPLDAVTQWAAALNAQNAQAAISLVCIDAFFKKEAFKVNVFQKKLASLVKQPVI